MPTFTAKQLNWLFLLLFASLATTLPALSQTITGTVFRDFNSDGAYASIPASGTYAYGEPGVGGVTVTAYSSNSATAPVSTTTNAGGSYTLTVGSASQFRIEFTNLTSSDYEGFRGTGSATSVQFVNGGTANVNFGINYPRDYCQLSPPLMVACYVSGDPLISGSDVASQETMVQVPYNSSGTSPSPTGMGTAAQIGSVWGSAYQRSTKKLFSSAFLKRHTGLGPLGLSGIYVTTVSASPTSTTYANVQTLGVANLGTAALGSRGLPASGTTSSSDPTAFSLVGKAGLGGMAISDDESKLYVVDLYNRQLLILNIGNPAKANLTAADMQTVAIPAPTCTDGVARPFGITAYKGKVYVGVVCTGENNFATAKSNLQAYVYVMDATTQTFNASPIFTVPLNYPKGDVHHSYPNLGDVWNPWTDTFANFNTNNVNAFATRTALPQPVLSSISFTDNGDMVLGFMDRAGHQLGYRQRAPGDNSANPTLYSGYVGGDILRARYDGTQWNLENNGKVSSPSTGTLSSGSGVGNGQGPGGGEFYAKEEYLQATTHQETMQGGMAIVPGTNQLVATVMDPLDVFSGGFSWFNNTNGNDDRRYQIYISASSGDVTLGKANGLGIIAVACNDAPIEIGNRVWVDANNNGIQDPGEAPLAGIKVTLTGPGLASPVSVTTNAAGEYYFSSSTSGTAATGLAFSLTGLTSGGSYSLTFPTSASAGALVLSSKPDSATGTNADNIDTDPNAAGVISFTLGQTGQNNFSYDAGYVTPTAGLGDYVFLDANKNGIQDAGDTPIGGVQVILYLNGVASATTTTASSGTATGYYSFTGLTPGSSNSYVVGFTAPAGYTTTTPLSGTDKAKDSDADLITGKTASVTLAPGEFNPTLDAGYYIPSAGLGDFVWLDTDKDGIQDAGEPGIQGVTVILYTNGVASATTVTNASGFYSFTGLTPGTSNSYVVGFTAPAGLTTTTPLSGTDKTKDSDADLITGKTQSVTLAPGEFNPTLDAGYYIPSAGLGDFVWLDTNKDGVQGAGEPGIQGVTVILYTNGVASATTVTNASGFYSFTGLTPGTSNSYVVGFTAPAGLTTTTPLSGTDKTKDSDADLITGKTQSVTLAPGEFNPTLDAGYYIPSAGLGDFVWLDTNKDGVQGAGEPGIQGVTVILYTNGVASATTVTSASGFYSFTGLTPGTSNSYVVGFTTPAGYTTTTPLSGTDKTKDSDADLITGKTASVTLAPGEFNPTLDAGYYIPSAGLGDFVWLDTDKDGIQDAGEPGIQGVTVILYTNGVASATTVTNASGFYSFTGLTPGSSNSYVVGFTAPAGYTTTSPLSGTDKAKDSDADLITGKTQSVTLAPGEFNPTLDAGYYIPSAGLGDFVWFDTNKNGVQDAGEPGIQGVTVILYTNGVASATTVTSASGFYSFTGLTPGSSNSYVVGFTAPAGYTTTSPLSGTDKAKDSDADLITGKTQSVTLAPGEFNPTLDAGYYIPSAGLGDFVWFDTNKNGIQDAGEPGIQGVTVILYTNGVASATTVTSASGFYSFTGLTPGTSNSYVVGFTAPAGYTTTSPLSGTDKAKDSDADPITGKTASVTLAPGEFNPTLDAGYYIPSAGLGDFVWLDTNKDGIQDAGEPGIQGVTVILYTNGVASATTVTSASGFYSFTGLTPGTSNSYVVGFTAPAGYTTTSPLSGTDKTKDSDADLITGKTQSVTLAPGEFNPTLDAGYYIPSAGLGDFVWLDTDKDGIQDAGEPGIQGVTVILYTNGVASATTVTNASGFYSFTGLTPGTSNSYVVGFTAPAGLTTTTPLSGTDKTKDSDADLITGKTQSVTLAPGEFNPTLDAGYYIPSAGLGDFVWLDTNKDGVQGAGEPGIQGVTVILYTNGVASATTVTSASGFYSFTGLTPGTSNSYVVGFTTPAGYTTTTPLSGTDKTKDSDADLITGKTASVTLAPGEFNPTLDAGYYIPSAGLGDFVWLDTDKDGIQDAGEPGIQGVTVILYTNGVASATTVTNASGFYSFTGLTPGSSNSYVVGFTAPAGYTTTSPLSGTDKAKDSDADLITGKTQSVTLAPGEFNPTLDAGYYIPSAGLGDFVWFDTNKNGVQDAGEPGIQGVTVILYTNGVASATTVTSASGFYSFTGLTPGSSNSYVVGFTAPAGYTTTSPLSGTDKAKDSDADLITGKTQSVTLAPGEFNPTLDAGYYIPSAGLGDFVWFDTNKNGIQDAGEPGIQGVTVILYTNGVASATTVTSASGFYSFTGLTPGTSNSYVVGFTAPAGYTTTSPLSGTDKAKDSDADPITGKTASVTLAPGEFNPTLDAGYYIPSAGLGDFVWLDTNKDGIQDAGEPGIQGVTVILYTNGVASATTVTSASGFYSFTGLTPGTSNSYVVGFTAPAGYTTTSPLSGTDKTKDSDADLITGKTQSVTLAPGEFNPTLDAGYYIPSAGLGDFVWLDTDKDGIQDAGEPGIQGVTVILYTNGVASATTVTNASGFYSFTGLTPGTSNSYVVGFTAPAGLTTTTPLSGTDKTKDSDADLITGKTQSVTLAPGEFNPTLDAGYYIPSAGLGDFVWLDTNKDGVQGAGEPGIQGVTVILYTNGVASATTVTSASGFYSFIGLTPGSSNSYVVGFTAPAGYTTTSPLSGTDKALDSDADLITGKTASVTLAPGEFNPTIDAGYYPPVQPIVTAGLGDFVWLDTDKDGIQDAGEPGIQGVTVILYTNGVASATTVTSASGFYSFTGLTPGTSNSYVVGFTPPAGFTTTIPLSGTDKAKDSDADLITGKTQSVTLAPGEFNPTIDAGYYIPTPKLTIDKLLSLSKAKIGDIISYTIVLTNVGPTSATNVVVRDSTSTGLTYVANSATPPAGTTFTQGTPISTWSVAAITAGQSLSLTFQAVADSSGILYNTASIPGDTARVCTSVPVRLCAGDQYAFTLTAPPGRSAYQWFKDNVAIQGATTNTLEVTGPGAYSLAVDNVAGKCADFSCCPFIIEEDTLPSFKATAVAVTCTGSTPQANGQIRLSEFPAGATYQYSAGASFDASAVLSGSKQVIPVSGVLVSNLANPLSAQSYTIRVYNGSGCYRDVTVLLMPTVCGCPADICVPFVLSQTKRAPRIGDPR